MNMETLETLIASPYFLAAIVACGIWLLLLVSREFALWFMNISSLEKRLGYTNEAINRIENQVDLLVEHLKTEKSKESLKPSPEDLISSNSSVSQSIKSSFPFSH